MRYLFIVIILGLFLLPTMAQEEELTPYENALQRIEAARTNSARKLDLTSLGLNKFPSEIGSLSNL